MRVDAGKLYLIEALLKEEDEKKLQEIEALLLQVAPPTSTGKRPEDFAGIWTEEEAEEIKNTSKKAAGKFIPMTGNKVILDTKIVIELFKKNEKVKNVIARIKTVCIPLIVLGELRLGLIVTETDLQKKKEIAEFMTTSVLLLLNERTANVYANTKARLLDKGLPVPENDIWIAAISLQQNLPLHTHDAQFREVGGLQLFNPLSPV